MEPPRQESDTESEHFDDAHGDTDADAADATKARLSPSPVSSPPSAPKHEPSWNCNNGDRGAGSIWNNVLVLAPTASAGHSDTSVHAFESVASPFVSPFATLHGTTDSKPMTTCPRCLAEWTLPGDNRTAASLGLCVCCKRPFPFHTTHGDSECPRRCVSCEKSDLSLEVILAGLSSNLRIAADAKKALETQETTVRAYDGQRKKYEKINALEDARILEISAQEDELEVNADKHLAHRQAVFANREATLDTVEDLFDEWAALEKQRVSLRLQRIVVLDEILASHFLPSPHEVVEFLRSLDLTPAIAFPMTEPYDSSEQCEECEILLRLPAPVIDEAVTPAFCDCCKRMLPSSEVRPARLNCPLSFCTFCRRRRDFSLISDTNLVPMPDRQWCKQLYLAAKSTGHRVLGSFFGLRRLYVDRMLEAEADAVRWNSRVNGVKYHQLAVLRLGNTPMEISRHWYAEEAKAWTGFEAVLFKQLLVCTEIGAGCRRKAWRPVIDLLEQQPKHSERVPEWLPAFFKDKWLPTPPKASKATANDLEKAILSIPNSSQQPQSFAFDIAQNSEASPNKVPVSASNPEPVVDFKCKTCGQMRKTLEFQGTGHFSCCDCCELVLPTSLIHTPSLSPRVSLCTSCFVVQSTTSPEDIALLVKRPDDKRIIELSSTIGDLRILVRRSDSAAETANAGPDNRRLSAEQEVECLKKARRKLYKQQKQAVASGLPQLTLRQKLYAEHIQTETSMLEALLDVAQVMLEILGQRQIEVPSKFRVKLDMLFNEQPVDPVGGNTHTTICGNVQPMDHSEQAPPPTSPSE